MAAITGATILQFVPNSNIRVEVITTPATADSNDTIDVSSSTVTGGNTFGTIYGVLGAFDNTTGDAVTATWSGTTITIDASGGTTDHVYRLVIMGI